MTALLIVGPLAAIGGYFIGYRRGVAVLQRSFSRASRAHLAKVALARVIDPDIESITLPIGERSTLPVTADSIGPAETRPERARPWRGIQLAAQNAKRKG